MSIVLPDRASARRESPEAVAAGASGAASFIRDKSLARILVIGASVFLVCLVFAKAMTSAPAKPPRATAMTLTPAAQPKKRLAEPRLPAREAPEPARAASPSSQPELAEASGASSERTRPVRRISLDANPAQNAPRAPALGGRAAFADAEPRGGAFAPMERSARYEGFAVTGGAR